MHCKMPSRQPTRKSGTKGTQKATKTLQANDAAKIRAKKTANPTMKNRNSAIRARGLCHRV